MLCGTAQDFRSKANEHGRKADELVSGDHKDAHLAAERLNNKAADAIEQAYQSTRKAETLD